ncbi:MAG TPA: squalene--hopene cyclase [Rhodanobacteraceae bacterium]|nr:squalene--hopene cyclase [Rhodanobacteraceae bacterium]
MNTARSNVVRLVSQGDGAVAADPLEAAIGRARQAILGLQHQDGCWCHELEADCTIPAEYVLMLHFFGESEPLLEQRIANYLRARQNVEGGWPLYEAGATDVSCSVKVYYALKLVGDDPEAPHMRHAREAILKYGGAARANVFTRMALAMFGQLPWRGVPWTPIELILLPRWFPFHVNKVSYWSRTVMTPLAVLCSLKARAKNPRNVDVRELFVTPPEEELHYFAPPKSFLARMFLWLDKLGHAIEPHMPKRLRARALERAKRWIVPRLNGEYGIGAIFPAMVNAAEALPLLGFEPDHPYCRQARKALRDLLVVHGQEAYCQPCTSPVWDTGLTCLALQEDLRGARLPALVRGLEWLRQHQLMDEAGDWRETHPGLRGGGWAFQFRNDAYPDLDDTAVCAWAMHRFDRDRYADCIERAADWLVGMQSRNGGFASFDADNTHYWLNQIPFADHGALLDPPTADVSARVLTLLARLQRPQDARSRERVLRFLREEQTEDGAWFGRWGTNYIYGTWSVLTALAALGMDTDAPEIRRAATWLKSRQREDGGWGETNDSYFDPTLAGRDNRSCAAQTAWALLGLMSAGEGDSVAVARGVSWLLRNQRDGCWSDPAFNAPGFPRVFYLKYHGYSVYFPYWALARYRNVRAGRSLCADAMP